MVRGGLFVVVVFGMLAGRGSLAWSVDPQAHVQAEKLIDQGYELRVKGNHAGALRLFQRAHELEPSGRSLGQMGLAEASLHRWGEAEAHLTAALASGDAWVVRNRAGLEEGLAVVRKSSGQAEKTSAPPTAGYRLIDAGMAARTKGDHAGALRLFQQAHELEPAPITLGLMGGEEYALQRWDEAEAHYAAALEQKDSEWVLRYRPAVERALAMAVDHIGNLVVTGSPDGALIYVNGRPRGTLPLKGPLRVNEGDLSIQITAVGHQPYLGHAQVQGRGGAQLEVALEKQKLVEVPVPAGAPAPTGDAVGGAPGLRTVAWVAAGGAVAALGVGLVLKLVRKNRLDDFNGSCRLDSTTQNRPMRFPAGGAGPDPCQGLYDSWNSSRPWPTVGYAAAGVLAVTSGVLFVVSRSDSASAKQARLDCRVGIGFATCGGRF